jgi:uracil-DNA glycosylase
LNRRIGGFEWADLLASLKNAGQSEAGRRAALGCEGVLIIQGCGPLNPDTVRLGYARNVGTNQNLVRLLNAHFGLTLGDLYATNLFPFIKLGGMSSAIPRKDLVRAAKEFGWPQIEIVAPRLVIALGLVTFNGLCEGKGRERASRMEVAIGNPVDLGSTRVWCQAHTGGRGLGNRGGKVPVSADWAAMASWYFSSSG